MRKFLGVLGGFPWVLPKDKGMEDQGKHPPKQKQSLRKLFRNNLYKWSPPCPFKTSRRLAERVCANCLSKLFLFPWAFFWGVGRYMREIGTMWQIGVVAGKRCDFLVQNGSFSAFWHLKNNQRRTKSTRKHTHPKTQVIDCPQNLRFRVCCVFGCSLFPSKRAPKHTRKRNTPETADSGDGRLPAFSGVLRFQVLFVLL